MSAAPRGKDDRPVFESAAFGGATFEGDAHFDKTTFKGDAHFDKTTFKGDAHFEKTSFKGDAHFPEAEFESHADFSEATFERAAHFPGVTIDGDARFREASMKEAFVIGPMLVRRALVLDGASFSGIEIRASADRLLCQRTQFHGPANLRVRWAKVALDGAVFESASLLGSSEAFDALHKNESDEPAHPLQKRLQVVGEREQRWRQESERFGRKSKPRLISLRGANVANLVVSDVDLGACLFAGAANLDGLRIEGPPTFPLTPVWRSGGARLRAWWRPPRWTRRQTLAEEHKWRFDSMSTEIEALQDTAKSSPALKRVCVSVRLKKLRHKRAGWYPESCRPPPWLPDPGSIDPPRLSALYRALRKGREDSKDAPGAADFYYGEMEMRRQGPRRGEPNRRAGVAHPAEQDDDARADGDSPGDTAVRPAPSGERLILWVYWLVSGYGLRASRALAALAITVAGGAALLSEVGFRDGESYDPPYDSSYWWALLLAMESAISLLRAPQVKLTAGGEIVEIGLRILGPLFVGLALLSLRGRVKR